MDIKQTTSLCPLCYRTIPAQVAITTRATMVKHCPNCQKITTATVEPSAAWYRFCEQLASPKFYDGYMIDVSSKCNLKCQYCYHDNTASGLNTDDILAKIDKNACNAPLILTGGEPTLNDSLPLILERTAATGPFIMLTNGVRLSEPDYYHSLVPLLDYQGILQVGLSFHEESNGADRRFLELCRQTQEKIATAFIVIDDIYQIEMALATYEEYQDVICSLRIKAASNLGAEHKAVNHIYTSEMVAAVIAHGGYVDDTQCNKISYASMKWRGKYLYLISWYNINNVDLEDIDGPPFYECTDGNSYNLVTTCLLNGATNANL